MKKIIQITDILNFSNIPKNDIDKNIFTIYDSQNFEDDNSSYIDLLCERIQSCGNPMLISSYKGQIESNYINLKNFIYDNKEELPNICPSATYYSTILMTKNAIRLNNKSMALRAIRFMSIIQNYYYLGDFALSIFLSQPWLERYQNLLEDKIPIDEIKLYLQDIDNENYIKFFKATSNNYNLYNQYKLILKSVLENEV